jgi:hypothetical protein
VQARHEALRTSFEVADGEPRQRIAESAPAALETVDLTGLSPTEQEEAFRGTVMRPFTLDTAPLWRASLLRTHPSCSLFVDSAAGGLLLT